MDCQQADAKLMDFLYGELSFEDRESFESHLRECSAHASEVGRLQTVLHLVRKDVREDPPERVSEQIMKQARLALYKKPRPAFWWRLLANPATIAAAVVGVLVTAGISVYHFKQESTSEPVAVQPTIPAATAETGAQGRKTDLAAKNEPGASKPESNSAHSTDSEALELPPRAPAQKPATESPAVTGGLLDKTGEAAAGKTAGPRRSGEVDRDRILRAAHKSPKEEPSKIGFAKPPAKVSSATYEGGSGDDARREAQAQKRKDESEKEGGYPPGDAEQAPAEYKKRVVEPRFAVPPPPAPAKPADDSPGMSGEKAAGAAPMATAAYNQPQAQAGAGLVETKAAAAEEAKPKGGLLPAEKTAKANRSDAQLKEEAAGLGNARIMEVIKGHRSSFVNCVKQQNSTDPSVQGTLIVSFVIQNNGNTSDIKIVSSKHQGTYAAGCVTSVIQSIRFPKFAGSPINVPRLTFSLKAP